MKHDQTRKPAEGDRIEPGQVWLICGAFDLYTRGEIIEAIMNAGARIDLALSAETTHCLVGGNPGYPAYAAGKQGCTMLDEFEFSFVKNPIQKQEDV